MPLWLLSALCTGLAFAAASSSTLTLKSERLAQRCEAAQASTLLHPNFPMFPQALSSGWRTPHCWLADASWWHVALPR
jgi:hypothetical protein